MKLSYPAVLAQDAAIVAAVGYTYLYPFFMSMMQGKTILILTATDIRTLWSSHGPVLWTLDIKNLICPIKLGVPRAFNRCI